MGYLIILRGSAGSGKTTIQRALIEELKDRGSTHYLHLDEIEPKRFCYCLEESLKSENVVAEMFYGNSHTDNPMEWMHHFKDRGDKILSVILNCELETCMNRVNNRIKSSDQNKLDDFCIDPGNRPAPNLVADYYKFKLNLALKPFATNAEIKQITIDTEARSITQIVSEIMDELDKL